MFSEQKSGFKQNQASVFVERRKYDKRVEAGVLPEQTQSYVIFYAATFSVYSRPFSFVFPSLKRPVLTKNKPNKTKQNKKQKNKKNKNQ